MVPKIRTTARVVVLGTLVSAAASSFAQIPVSDAAKPCIRKTVDSDLNKPVLAPLSLQSKFIEGKVVDAPAHASLSLCIIRKSVEKQMDVSIAADGTFSASMSGFDQVGDPAKLGKVLDGDVVVAQVKLAGDTPSYGPATERITLHDSCSTSAKAVKGQDAPTIKLTLGRKGTESIKGGFPAAKKNSGNSIYSVRLCINDIPADEIQLPSSGAATPDATPTFGPMPQVLHSDNTYAFSNIAVAPTDKLSVQVVENTATDRQTSSYEAQSIELSAPPPVADNVSYRYIFVGGVEQSGYSSLSLSTEPFIQLYLEGAEQHKLGYWAPWTKLRLLGAPQPSTNGIASTFTDPTGTITKQDFTKVGQSIDVVGGVQLFLRGPGLTRARPSIIAYGGTTTPLSNQSVAYTFKVPGVATAECQQLITRFSPGKGYNPGLVADPTKATCLTNNGTTVTDIAFANQDRTNFLAKWGVGLRGEGTTDCTGTSTDCLASLGLIDLTIGQDASVTRGQLRHFVVKADALLPIKTGETSYIYLFGSIYTRLTRNYDSSPLILAAETTPPTLPNAAVVVLPLVQPDRDFFRLGVGINLTQVFAKLFAVTK